VQVLILCSFFVSFGCCVFFVYFFVSWDLDAVGGVYGGELEGCNAFVHAFGPVCESECVCVCVCVCGGL